MAHDTTASVRARYLPVTSDEVTGSVPSDGMDYLVTVGKRRKWWWQSGPVYSCCLCFSLDVGIVILAGLKVVGNCYFLLLIGITKVAMNVADKSLMDIAHQSLAVAQKEYESRCTGDWFTMSENDCRLLEQYIHRAQDQLSSDEHSHAILYVYEYLLRTILVMGLVGGVAGLWAGCGHNTLAAKLFFWSSLVDLLLKPASLAVQLTMGQLSRLPIAVLIFYAVLYLLDVYFTKVSWSFYAVLKARDINTSPDFGSGIEPPSIADEDGRGGGTA